MVIEHPVANEENDRPIKGEQPPVRKFLVVFLDAIVFVFTKDDFALFFGEVAAFRFLAHEDFVGSDVSSSGRDARRFRSFLSIRKARIVTAVNAPAMRKNEMNGT